MSPVRCTGYSGARAGHMLFADKCRQAWAAGRPQSCVGCAAVLPRPRSTRATLFAGMTPAATATEPDVGGTTPVGRLPDPNYAPRVRAERLIATGRVVLAAFSLLAVWIAPPTPAGHTNATTLLLAAYLGYALMLALVAWFAYARVLRFGLLTHALDLALFSLFVYLAEGPASPFCTYFVCALVAATLRWQSRGALWTAAMAVLAFNAVGLYAAQVIRDPNFELDRFFTRSAYLVVLPACLQPWARTKSGGVTNWPAWQPG